ncbi:hypothetical protein F4604DRAFT_1938881 [Suillus subluteus]|nr:hypothetical protein F4604DRAFT_1938881 [Suillus subluteus]
MIHNRSNSSLKATRIPVDVIDLFWNEVVLPSISQEAPNSSLPYVDTTVHEIRYKSRKGGSGQSGSHRPKATPVSGVAFERIKKSMKTRVRDQAMLAPYGSFFFVLEGKGIKLWTKDGQNGRYNSPYEALKANFTNLDWDHMMDRNNGELYLDVGISFNPTGQFVGLWRLDALKASFQKGGFKKGAVHHTNTLGRYGGIQAEMLLAHARPSQICFRSAYQLCYEAIRPNNNQPKLISDRDAYHLTEAYLKECGWMHEIYSGGPSRRAYGCRDEYRMSGQAALEVLPYLKKQVGLQPSASPFMSLTNNDQAEAFMKSQPILWIPSKVWFGLMNSRLEGLRRAQKTLKVEKPLNYGIQTSILCHLLRSLTSTPIVMDLHLRQSLQSLDVERIRDRDGMLFLYDAQQTIIKEDNAEVHKIMGANVKSRPKTLTPSNPITSSDDWPIGPQPSWKDVGIESGLLFVQFTREFWLQLGGAQTTNDFMDAVTINPRICNNLQEAMACSAGLEGDKPGRPHLSFVQRRTTFFPHKDTPPPQSSKWKIYWTEGYIAHYHEMCSELSEAQLEHLHERLDILFSNLQCLPDANKPTAKSPGSTWTLASGQDSIKIVTNPCFYRIQKSWRQKEDCQEASCHQETPRFPHNHHEHAGTGSKEKKPEQRKPQVDRRSLKAKRARKPPTRQIKTTGPVTSTSNRTNKKHSADLEYDTNSNSNTHDGSASETNSLFDQKDNNAADHDESEMDSLFDYDGSGEEADEEGNDSDVSMY